MRLHATLALTAATAALAFAAPTAAAEPICAGTAGDGTNPLRSSACVAVTGTSTGYRITTSCSLLNDQAACAIKPVDVHLYPVP